MTAEFIHEVILVGYAQTIVVRIVLLTGGSVYTELSGRFRTSKLDRKSWSVLLCLSLPFDVEGLVMDLCLIQLQFLKGLQPRHWKTQQFCLPRSPGCSKMDGFDVSGLANMARLEQLGNPSCRLLQNNAICRPRQIKHWKRLGLAELRTEVGGGGGATSGGLLKQRFGSKSMVFISFGDICEKSVL